MPQGPGTWHSVHGLPLATGQGRGDARARGAGRERSPGAPSFCLHRVPRWQVRPLGVPGEETWPEADSVPSSPASRALHPLQEGPSQGTAFWLPGGPAARGALWPRVLGLGVWAGARVESLPRLATDFTPRLAQCQFQVTENSREIIFKTSLQTSCFYLFRAHIVCIPGDREHSPFTKPGARSQKSVKQTPPPAPTRGPAQ